MPSKMKDQKPGTEELLNLENLTEAERSRILEVLKRDDELQDAQNTRISEIKSEINAMRMKGVLRQGEDGAKICSRCREQFGYIFNTGEICPQCKYKVCKNCKENTFHGAWVCVLCYKRRQLRALTGEWLLPTLSLEKKSKNLYLSAPDLIRKSIRRKGSDDDHNEEDDDGQDNVANGNARYISASPEFESSSLSSDNLSLQGNDMGYPGESDKRMLSSLVHTHSHNDNGQPGIEHPMIHNNNNNTVHKISSKRYEDTESSSSSDNGDERTLSPLISAVTSPSVRSSYSPTLSTGRTTPASEIQSDHEDGRYGNDRNQNGGSPSSPASRSSEHFKIQQPPASPKSGRVSPFDDSAYRAHSELPDIDDLIQKSKSKQEHHSPLSSMTSSPTPSTHGQRLLDLANVSDSLDGSDKEQPPSQKQRVGKHGKNKAVTKSSLEDSTTSWDQTDASSGHGYDSGHLTGTSQENSPEHRHSKKASVSSIPSITVSSVEEEDESIDDLVASHKPGGKTFSQSFGNLFSSHGGSRESIASYYSQAGAGNYGVVEVTGAVQFAVDYKHKTGVLEIHVKQGSDLAAVDDKRKRSDPYVKTYLLPDRTKTGKKKTHAKKNTLNPVFNEILRYHVPKSELQSRTLWLSVWHNDRFGRNIFLGEVTLPFNYHTFDSTPQWYTLQDREEMEPAMLSYKGDLILSLKYIPADEIEESSPGMDKKKKKKISVKDAGQLCVMVKEARNLTGVRANGFSDSFCKGYLLPEKARSVKQKTAVIKKDCNPKWSHMFTFDDLSPEDLEHRCLELTVWDHDRFSSNDFLGGIRLNLGTGRSHGKEVEWMDARGEEISIWQSMMDRPNVWIDGNLTLRANMDKRQ